MYGLMKNKWQVIVSVRQIFVKRPNNCWWNLVLRLLVQVLYCFLFCIIFFLFKWLCWMVTLLKAVGLERIIPKYMYFSVC